MSSLLIPPTPRTAELEELRHEVRGFLGAEIEAGRIIPRVDAWQSGIDREFSRRLAGRGWVGMRIPAEYGGHDRSAVERFVVTEELLAHGAPVAAHWIADRQMAPSIIRHGSVAQKRKYLPAIARAEAFFAIGMSEPGSGSDLASVRTRAVQDGAGWRLTGTKVWTSCAHIATSILVLARSEDADRHAGLSQFIVDLPHPQISIRPIITIDGAHHFNEVIFDDAWIPMEALLGVRGQGWGQVMAELAYERSGPERVLSTFPLLAAWAAEIDEGDKVAQAELGRLVARLVVLRQMSLGVAGMLESGVDPVMQAAMVKDLGTAFESDLVDTVRRAAPSATAPYDDLLTEGILHGPAFTLRGGTTEILRSIVAKGLSHA